MSATISGESDLRPSYEISSARRVVLTLSVVLATFMQTLDSTIANVALPYMQGTMSASQDQINWVLTSYIVATAIATALTGFLASRFGRTRLFVAGVIGFSLASMLCGTAQSLDQIVLFRTLQGFSGAAMVPLSQSILYDIYPVERRAFGLGLWVLGANVGPVLGPILGGWLTAYYSWRWIFYINLPIGVMTAVGTALFLKETPHGKSQKLDWLGFLSLSLAIGAFQLMLDRGETQDWFSSREIIVEACVAGVGMYIFIVQIWLAPKPFFSRRILTDVNFLTGNLFIFIQGLVPFATLALLAPYLQDLMNFPVLTAGLVLAPRGVGAMAGTLLCARLLRYMSPRALVASGIIMNAASLYKMSFWTPDVSQWNIDVIGFLQGFSLSLVFVPLSMITLSGLPQTLRTEASGIFSLMRNLGSSIGISVTAALLVRNTQLNQAIIGTTVTPFSRNLQSGAVSRLWDPASIYGSAALNAEIMRQASIIAYMDDFKLMFYVTVAVLPLIFLIRPQQAPAPSAP